eukprot:CAMPEP_0174738400 /NCGR_PEP_ID=MMETSP1094-20130205/69879_1 /TAXON_ID=156173 /ORGANISM="Chrysochromulina brevifilum, Strain UTEX LB 985" /LENGTH=99 /DNA_ID=CAMNT_0015941801 /DNA_START=44 /DNA_END=339 /DNA_ORIENTATION=-
MPPASRQNSQRGEGKSKKGSAKRSTKKGIDHNLEAAPETQQGMRSMATELLERFAPRWVWENNTTQDVLRKDLRFDLADPQASFDAHAVEGKLRDADLR